MQMNPGAQISAKQMSGGMRFGLFISGLLFALFGLLTIQYAMAIVEGTKPWLYSVLYYLIQYPETFEPGYLTVQENLDKYRELMLSMSSHAMLGGFLVMLGTFQFIPSLRRKHRNLHRASGAFLLVCMTVVSVSGIHYLLATTPSSNISGQAFYFTLFAVAALSLGLISQAVLAAASRDFRSHMVWIGLAFCCFLTAPLLRFNYLVVGGLDPQVLNRLVQNSSPTVLLQAFVLWMLWLIYVGDKDLPVRSTQQTPRTLPDKVIRILVSASIASLLMIGVGFFVSSEYFSGLLAVFILTKVIQSLFSANAWQAALAGKGPTAAFSASTVASVVAGLMLAFSIDTTGFTAHAIFYCLVHFAVLELLLLVFAYTLPKLATGVQVFGACLSAMAWMWAGFPAVMVGLWLFGFGFDVGVINSYVLVAPNLFVLAVVIATYSNWYFSINKPVSGKANLGS